MYSFGRKGVTTLLIMLIIMDDPLKFKSYGVSLQNRSVQEASRRSQWCSANENKGVTTVWTTSLSRESTLHRDMRHHWLSTRRCSGGAKWCTRGASSRVPPGARIFKSIKSCWYKHRFYISRSLRVSSVLKYFNTTGTLCFIVYNGYFTILPMNMN